MIAKKVQGARFAERHLRCALNTIKELHEWRHKVCGGSRVRFKSC